MKLRDIDFGFPDAVADAHNLRRNGVVHETEAWTSRTDNRVSAYFGRKGSGKTALRLAIERPGQYSSVVSLTFRDFGNESLGLLIDDLRDAGHDVSRFFRSTWRLAIVGAAASAAYRSPQLLGPHRNELTACRALLENAKEENPKCENDKLVFSLFDMFMSAARGARLLHSDKSRGDSDRLLYPYTALVKAAEAELVSMLRRHDKTICITIDDFDEDYGRFHDVVRLHTEGLLDAIREHQFDFAQSPLVVKAFIPRDTMPPYEYRHIDKLAHEVMEWRQEDLDMFVAKRIHPSAIGEGGVPRVLKKHQDAMHVIDLVMPRLSGHSDYRNAMSWLVHCSHQRPRDLQFILIELQARKLRVDPDAASWTETDLYTWLPSACNKLAGKIIKEYSNRYPELSVIIQSLHGKDAEIDRKQLESLFGTMRLLNRAVASYWISALYECGILASVLSTRKGGPGSPLQKVAVCAWHQQLSGGGEVSGDSFVIHQLFWNALANKKPSWPFVYPDW